jgi:transposase
MSRPGWQTASRTRSGATVVRSHRLAQAWVERIPANDPTPEELVLMHDMDEVFVQEQVDRDCRYAQKVARRRKKIFKWALSRLPKNEAEAVKLSLRGKTQREIAEIQGISQPTIHDRLQRATRRFKWLCTVGWTVTPQQLKKATHNLLRAQDRRILVTWWETGSQIETARRVFGIGDGHHQKTVRRAIIHSKYVIQNVKGMSRISKAIESLWNEKELLAPRRPENRAQSA